VVPLGSKALFALAGLGLIASIAYGVATKDSSATTVLGFVAVGAFALGVAVLLAGADQEPWVATDAPLAEQPPAGGRGLLPSAFPLVAAAAFGTLALAAATNVVVGVVGLVLAAVAGLGWLFQVWTEDGTYSAGYGLRIKERLLLPVGLPVGVVALVGAIAISVSRVFLALPEKGTRVAAIVIAIVILLSAFAIASSKRVARTALVLLTTFAFVAVIAAGIAGQAHGERSFEKAKGIRHYAPLPGQPSTVAASDTAGATGSSATTAAPTTTTGS